MFQNIRKGTQCRPTRPGPTPRDGARGCPLRAGVGGSRRRHTRKSRRGH